MKYLTLILLLLPIPAFAGVVGLELQKVSVNIKAGRSEGSGTVVLRDRVDGKKAAFVVTAAHVIRGLRSAREAIVDGKKEQIVKYDDAQIVQEVSDENGSRIVGDTRLDARVLCVDYARDIAILQVRASNSLGDTISFYRGKLPAVGTAIYHCGAPGGQRTGGSSTLTAGIVSRTGVRISDFGGAEHGVYDQVDCAAMPGSSGGMVCLQESGEWIGMITLGLSGGDNFHWIVPIRHLQLFCKEANLEFLLDGKVESLDSVPLELSPPN